MKRVTSKALPQAIPKKGVARKPARKFSGVAGRPKYERVEAISDWVKTCVAAGLAKEKIAALIINPESGEPIHVQTLEKYYARELATGLDEANVAMSRSAYMQGVGFAGVPNPNFNKVDVRKYIMDGKTKLKNPHYGKVDKVRWLQPPIAPVPFMTQWWEKTRAGKKEGMTIEHAGEIGGGVVILPVVVLPQNGREVGGTPILDLLPRRGDGTPKVGGRETETISGAK